MYLNSPVIPITGLRVKSYVNNPNSLPSDVVLYMGTIQNRLVAFRTLFAGVAHGKYENIRFAWCSGNWVHPGFRRRGFSEQLLTEAFSDWSGKLMFTNYAPDSEKLYLKFGRFKSIHQFRGFRGYLFPKTRKLVPLSNRNPLTKLVFSFADYFIFGISAIRVLFFSPVQNHDIRFETAQFPDESCFSLLQNNSSGYLFKRFEQELNWIFGFPWISNHKSFETVNYPFSAYSKLFYYQTVKVFKTDKLVGFFIFSVRDGHLKTLYFNLPAGFEKDVAAFLKQYIVSHKIEVATVYNYSVSQQLFAQKFPFLHAKKFGQKIYSSFDIGKTEDYLFQDGDGDVIFT